MTPILGCIADDFTGGTDLANTLTRQGMSVMQILGNQQTLPDCTGVDALVISLKCRSTPAAEAVASCLRALDTLQRAGCRQILQKYCSTFDSTAQGNIGPIAVALLQRLGGTAIVCPAFPENGRTVVQGKLYVNGIPLDESPMKDHPLTPMRDADLTRLFTTQAHEPCGLIPLETVRRGAASVREAVAACATAGLRFFVADAGTDEDLYTLGEAVSDAALVTGGSGIALGLPRNYRRQGLLPPEGRTDFVMAPSQGGTAILAGSCSVATQTQLARLRERHIPMFCVDVYRAAEAVYLEEVAHWAKKHLEAVFCVYATVDASALRRIQADLGREHAGQIIEAFMANIAKVLREAGVTRFMVAGGETSGAVVDALQIQALHIGPQIAPGVPWTQSTGETPLALVLKSGNFGGPDFFTDALSLLPS